MLPVHTKQTTQMTPHNEVGHKTWGYFTRDLSSGKQTKEQLSRSKLWSVRQGVDNGWKTANGNAHGCCQENYVQLRKASSTTVESTFYVTI